MANKSDLLQGTLDLLILKTLQPGPMHGWGISLRIQEVSEDVLQVNQGSLYPALHRLEQQGLIAAEWGSSENKRQAKFYELTRAGGVSWRTNQGVGAARGRGRPSAFQIAAGGLDHAALDEDPADVAAASRTPGTGSRSRARLPHRHAH